MSMTAHPALTAALLLTAPPPARAADGFISADTVVIGCVAGAAAGAAGGG